jgi:hypothetical protein
MPKTLVVAHHRNRRKFSPVRPLLLTAMFYKRRFPTVVRWKGTRMTTAEAITCNSHLFPLTFLAHIDLIKELQYMLSTVVWSVDCTSFFPTESVLKYRNLQTIYRSLSLKYGV